MTTDFLSKVRRMFHNVYLFLVDEKYCEDVLYRLSNFEVKMRKKVRYTKWNQFLFGEQIEADEL